MKFLPHPEERPLGRVSKDGPRASWFETAQESLLTMRGCSMHRGEKPRRAEAGQPGPYRLAADAEIPRSDHGVGAADQIIDRQHPDAAVADGDAAVGGGVAGGAP